MVVSARKPSIYLPEILSAKSSSTGFVIPKDYYGGLVKINSLKPYREWSV